MKKRNSFRHIATALSSLGVLLLASFETAAQSSKPEVEGHFNVQSFNPGAGPRNFITTRGARTEGEQGFSTGFVASYARKPFVADSTNEDFGDQILIIENLFTFGLLGSYTPLPQLQIGLHAPLVMAQGQGITPDAAPDLANDGVKTFAVSDPELEVKYRISQSADAMIVPGVAAFVTAPLGKLTAKDQHVGRKFASGGLRGIVDFKSGPLSAAVNLGYRIQRSARIGESEIGSRAFYGLAAGFAASPMVRIVADLFGATQFSGLGTNPAEIDLVVQVTPLNTPIMVQAGAGTALTIGAVGVPSVRGILGITYTHEESDKDGDGILDGADQCPTEAEDKDGYEDTDGCAELDNDGDAIPDTADKCPNDAEDLDQFEDSDGCPDKDNDKDGIPDVQDRCPNEAEVVNGFEDEDGCPDVPDTDGDGVKDPDDKCPEEAEDTDGYQDTDGCPDPDNDGDGIPDDQDECVDDAENMNGVEDEDGCPEEEEAEE